VSFTVVSIDRTTLPAALLVLAKGQSRITNALEDDYVTELIAQAIDDTERASNATIFERVLQATNDLLALQSLAWWGFPFEYCAAFVRVALPFNNVQSVTATDADSLDVSAGYVVIQADPGGVSAAYLQAPTQAPGATPIAFEFVAGLPDVAKIAPSLRRAILRRFSALYENREATLTLAAPLEPGEAMVWRPDV